MPVRDYLSTLYESVSSTPTPACNAAQVKAGAEMAIGATVIIAEFDGEFSSVDQLYAGKGGFR